MQGAVFAWREGNSFELLIDGPTFFPAMLTAIAGARQRIDFECYLLHRGVCADAVLSALKASAMRGVEVRCLFDGFGAQGLSNGACQRLLLAGVQLRHYNPLRWGAGFNNLYRDHRKLLIIDSQQAFVGGTGVTDEFWRQDQPQSQWHEVMVAQRGPLVADWQLLFERQWQACLSAKAWRALPASGWVRVPALPASAPGLGRVAYASAGQHQDILQALLRALLGSRERIWLATPYFLPTWKVRRALRKAAARGVDVRLLLTGLHTDNQPVRFAGQRFYPKLLRAGVRIFEYQPRFLHLKMVLVDEWVSVGSCNFDHWNLRFNLDANLESHDPGLAESATRSLLADFARSEEVTLAQWQALPLWQRLQQRLWGWVDGWLMTLFTRWS